ncbi:MAG TPA: hypothetical protein PKA63_12065 [Oligoflexia bacterium]|nr:hypothetical protein [Oligoflexia bacterium]HMP49390.1 hypothetical protein [Oligoflexia bacterium]
MEPAVDPRYYQGRGSAVPASPGVDPKLKLGIDERRIESNGYSAFKNNDGSISIEIPNRENSVSVGYVRKNGSYSNPSSDTQIRRNNGFDRLVSIFQSGTYKLDVSYENNGSTTIKVKPDNSLQAIKINLGGKVYYIELDKVGSSSSTKGNSEPQPVAARVVPNEVATSVSQPVSSQAPANPSPVSDARPSPLVMPPVAQNTTAKGQEQISESASGSVAPQAVMLASARIAKLIDTSQRNGPSQGASRAERQAKIQEYKSAVSASKSVSGADLAENNLKQLSENEREFHRNVSKEEKALIRESEKLAKKNPTSPRLAEIQNNLRELRDLRTDRLIAQGKMAEIICQEKDASGQQTARAKEAGKFLRKNGQKIVDAYNHKADFTTDSGTKDSLKSARNNFIDSVKDNTGKELKQESGKLRSKISGVLKWDHNDAISALRDRQSKKAWAGMRDVPADEMASDRKGLKKLQRLEDRYIRREARLENGEASGKKGDALKLEEIRSQRQEITLKRAEVIRHKLNNPEGMSQKQIRSLEKSLYEEMKPRLEKAYQGKPELAEYTKKSSEYEAAKRSDELSKPRLLRNLDVSRAEKALGRWDQALKKTPDSEYLKAERALADHDLKVAKQEAIKGNSASSATEKAAANKEIDVLRSKRIGLVENVHQHLDQKITETVDVAEKAKLSQRLVKVEASYTKELQLSGSHSHEKLASIIEKQLETQRAELGKVQGQLSTETDASAKSKLEIKAKNIELNIARHEMHFAESQLKAIQTQQSVVNDELVRLRGEINNPSKPLSDSDRLLKEKQIKALELSQRELNTRNEYNQGIKKLASDKFDLLRASKDLGALEQKIIGMQDGAAKIAVQKQIDDLKIKKENLGQSISETRSSFNKVWSERIQQGLRRIRPDFLTLDRVMKVRFPGSANIESRPGFALAGSFALTESLGAVLKSDVSPEARHNILPGLVAALNEDLYELTSFTTADYGHGVARFADATSSALTVGGFAGAMYGGQRMLQMPLSVAIANRTGLASAIGSTAGQKIIAGTGRVLGGAGTAYYGYSQFSSGQFRDQDNMQLAGSIGSPISAGAITGFALGGPVGAAIGGGLGALGEGAGVVRGLYHLDSEFENNVRRMEIKNAVEDAEKGFIHPPEEVPSRSLDSYEKETVELLAQDRAYGRIFGTKTKEELKKMGFNVSASGNFDENERREAAQNPKNWDLFNWMIASEGRGYLNPKTWVGYGDAFRGNDTLRSDLNAILAESRNKTTELYLSAIRRKYQHNQGEVSSFGLLFTSSNRGVGHGGIVLDYQEMKNKVVRFESDIANLSRYDRPSSGDPFMNLLAQHFPGIGVICLDEASSVRFTNQFSENLQPQISQALSILNQEIRGFEGHGEPVLPRYVSEDLPSAEELLDLQQAQDQLALRLPGQDLTN